MFIYKHFTQDEKVNKMRKELENTEPLPFVGLQHYNILLIGLIGAGKSSVFNTVASVFANEVKVIASTADGLYSVTNKVRIKILHDCLYC